jgi:branched-chain amino acid transport system substrate-binding protein
MPDAAAYSGLALASRRATVCATLSLGLALLAGCSSSNLGPLSDSTPLAPAVAPPVAPVVGGDSFGAGPVKVAAILPLTQNGQPSAVGQSLRNAAQLAVEESGANDITLTVLDDRSTPDGAAQAAQAAIGGGAEILLGPLFAADVRQVATVAKAANKPVIAFSTDASVSSSGVYLLSFLIEGYVDRVMEYAASKGKKTFAVMAPQTDFGNVVVNEAQLEASRLNVQVSAIARYAPGQSASGAPQVVGAAPPADAVLIAEPADSAGAAAAALTSKGYAGQILGTGVWADSKALSAPALNGAWIAAPENAGFAAFAQRYRAKFNTDPVRLATLAYDSVSLVAALARTQGAQRFSASVLTSPSGFNGADGVFRFHPEGPNDRGLAVLKIGAGGTTVLSPAPKSFAGG